MVGGVRPYLWSAAVLLLLSALTIVIVRRRNGRNDQDLLASHMRTIAASRPVGPGNGTTETPPRRAQRPIGGVDDATWRRIGELAVGGRRVQAIELLRSVTGCRLTEAKAVVDRLTQGGARDSD
jgi:ribosomal protein L7/L12